MMIMLLLLLLLVICRSLLPGREAPHKGATYTHVCVRAHSTKNLQRCVAAKLGMPLHCMPLHCMPLHCMPWHCMPLHCMPLHCMPLRLGQCVLTLAACSDWGSMHCHACTHCHICAQEHVSGSAAVSACVLQGFGSLEPLDL